MDGGASATTLLMQIQADVIGSPVLRPRCVETTAMGAAYLAGLAVGYWSGKDEILRNWAVDRAGREAGERERNRPLPTYADEVMGDDDAPCGALATDDDTPEEERSASLVLALELLQSYPLEKRYIVLTYLLCDCYGESGRQLRLPARLAEQLGMEEAGVRQEKSRTFRKLRENAEKYLEKGVTFPSDDV